MALLPGDDERRIRCPRCNSIMTEIQECHLKCGNCGAELDCSDKGWIW